LKAYACKQQDILINKTNMQVGKDLKEENFQATSQYSSKGEHHAKVQWKFGISLHTINIELHHIFCTHPLKRESRKGGMAQTEGLITQQKISVQEALSYLQKDDTDKRSHKAKLFLLGVTPML
jgi:hypothetical protein